MRSVSEGISTVRPSSFDVTPKPFPGTIIRAGGCIVSMGPTRTVTQAAADIATATEQKTVAALIHLDRNRPRSRFPDRTREPRSNRADLVSTAGARGAPRSEQGQQEALPIPRAKSDAGLGTLAVGAQYAHR